MLYSSLAKPSCDIAVLCMVATAQPENIRGSRTLICKDDYLTTFANDVETFSVDRWQLTRVHKYTWTVCVRVIIASGWGEISHSLKWGITIQHDGKKPVWNFTGWILSLLPTLLHPLWYPSWAIINEFDFPPLAFNYCTQSESPCPLN